MSTSEKFDGMSIGAVTRSPTLSTRVTATIEQLIADNELVPGDRMPSERVLAEKFEVSRTVIREAVRSLVAKGLIDVRRGSGTVVRGPQTDFVSQSMGLLLAAHGSPNNYDQVHEVRLMLEETNASLAAQRRTEHDIMRLERALDGMIKDHDRESFSVADVSFHSALAVATQNPLLVVLHDSIAGVMIAVRQQAFDKPGSVMRAQSHHRKVFEAVRDGNPEAAVVAMSEHLVDSKQLIESEPLVERGGKHDEGLDVRS